MNVVQKKKGVKVLEHRTIRRGHRPAGDLTKLCRRQFPALFRVADTSRRGLVSWEDFVVFETLLKRADADYYVAFQYFDVYV